MKRMFSFFLAFALLAVLSGCGKREPTPSRPDEPTPPPEEGITLAELNVEFVAGDRDTDALMQLKKELPPLLIGALADEGVTVGRVNVTFGASDEATADALARGSVQVGFMPMETYLAHEDTLRLVSVPEEPAGDTERVGLYFPASDQNRTLRAAFEKDAADGGALHIVLLALCGAVAGYLCDRYLVRNLVSALLMSLMCLLFCQLVLFLFKCMVSSIGIQGLLPVLAQVGLSLLLCPPVYLAAWAIRKAGA